MTSTEVPMPETDKQHLGMVDVRLDTPAECYFKNVDTGPVYPQSQGYSVQPGYQPQQKNVTAEAPPSYSQKTNYTQPQSQTTVVRTAPRSTTAFSGAPRGSQHVPDYSRFALMVTLCCCLPFGLVAYFMASRAKDKQLYGDVDGARASSSCSLGWSIVGLVCGILITASAGVYYFIILGSYY